VRATQQIERSPGILLDGGHRAIPIGSPRREPDSPLGGLPGPGQ
jgi:hypothetical protein